MIREGSLFAALRGLLAIAFLVALSHQPSFAISYVYLNGESYVEVEIPDAVDVTADCAQPGNRLTGRFFLDLNENGMVDGGEPLTQLVYINDGIPTLENESGDDIPGDDDAQVNGLVLRQMEFAEEDVKITSTPAQLILRVTDQDGSSAQAMLRIIPPPAARPCIGGTVTDAGSAEPLDTVVVRAEEATTDEVKTTLTDEQGNYVLKLQAGTWQVFASEHYGYYAPSDTQMIVLGAADSAVVDVTMSAHPAYITGRADSTGKGPVSGVKVVAISPEEDLYAGHTRADGSYRIGVSPGTYDLYLFAPPGFAYLPGLYSGVMVDSGATVEGKNFTLGRTTARIQGRVTYQAGGGAGVVTVIAYWVGGYYYTTATNVDGNYSLTVMPATYFITAQRQGYQIVSPPPGFYLGVPISFNQTLSGYDFVIAPEDGEPLAISGTVTYQASGDPVAGAYVVIYNDQEDSPLGWGFAETDTNGHYEFGDISAGTWLIGVYQPGYGSEPLLREQTLSPGGPSATQQDFQLMPSTGVPPGSQVVVPRGFCLFQNRPNPFNSSTLIAYTLSSAEPQMVTVRIFNVLGQEIRILVDENQGAGLHLVRWDGRDLGGGQATSGIYFCELRAGAGREIRKMVLLR
jgi:hypothetical protein